MFSRDCHLFVFDLKTLSDVGISWNFPQTIVYPVRKMDRYFLFTDNNFVRKNSYLRCSIRFKIFIQFIIQSLNFKSFEL